MLKKITIITLFISLVIACSIGLSSWYASTKIAPIAPTVPVISVAPTVAIPTSTPITSIAPAPPQLTITTPTPDPRCIITVDSVRYDVTSYRKQHKGGDIFTCGTDMSVIFHNQHDNEILRKMARYKI